MKSAGFEVKEFDWSEEAQIFGGCENKHSLIRDEKIFFARKRGR